MENFILMVEGWLSELNRKKSKRELDRRYVQKIACLEVMLMDGKKRLRICG